MGINDIIEMTNGKFKSYVKHFAQGGYNELDIIGIQESLMETVYHENYNPSDHIRDPFYTNKNYASLDIVKMLYDIEEYSTYSQKYDPKQIMNNINRDVTMTSEIYNLILSEGLRGLTFQNLGDEIYICFYGTGPNFLGVIEDSSSCRIK
jgi:hypothetical protein